jgi:hypothetical protein
MVIPTGSTSYPQALGRPSYVTPAHATPISRMALPLLHSLSTPFAGIANPGLWPAFSKSSDVPSAPAAKAESKSAPAMPPMGPPNGAFTAAPGGSGPGGSGASKFFAVLVGLLTLAAIRFSKLRIPPVAWRTPAIVSLIERPG